jgi:hypothetical protein
MNENEKNIDETTLEHIEPIEHEPGIDPDAETYGDDDEIHDPEFDAMIMGIEAIARRVLAEWRQATATPPQEATDATTAQAEAIAAEAIAAEATELEAEPAEPEPGTSEYDDQHGIPFFELYR